MAALAIPIEVQEQSLSQSTVILQVKFFGAWEKFPSDARLKVARLGTGLERTSASTPKACVRAINRRRYHPRRRRAACFLIIRAEGAHGASMRTARNAGCLPCFSETLELVA